MTDEMRCSHGVPIFLPCPACADARAKDEPSAFDNDKPKEPTHANNRHREAERREMDMMRGVIEGTTNALIESRDEVDFLRHALSKVLRHNTRLTRLLDPNDPKVKEAVRKMTYEMADLFRELYDGDDSND